MGKKTGIRPPLEQGQRWGRLTWTGEAPQTQGTAYQVPVRCDCGEERWIFLANLKRGISKSCGCLRRELTVERNTTHGLANTRVQSIWSSMWTRCTNPKCNDYEHYGGRGIMPCEKWRTLEGFVEDMGMPPDGLTLERKDGNLGYNKDNCEWATYTTQARNRSNALWFDWEGKSVHLKELCAQYSLDYQAVYWRLFVGKWSLEDALLTPSQKFQ